MSPHNTYLVLENIRSAENVGAIFRTADATGVSKIYLCGITPAPTDRFGREQQKIKKTALGAEESVAWEQREDTAFLIRELRNSGVRTVALEQSKDAQDYKDISVTTDTAFIVGAEVDGVSPEVLEIVDVIAEIPMKGAKESLNVSVSVGVFLYRVLGI